MHKLKNLKITGINLITSPVDDLTEERLDAINEIMKEEPAGGHKTSAITDVTIRHFVIAYYSASSGTPMFLCVSHFIFGLSRRS